MLFGNSVEGVAIGDCSVAKNCDLLSIYFVCTRFVYIFAAE